MCTPRALVAARVLGPHLVRLLAGAQAATARAGTVDAGVPECR